VTGLGFLAFQRGALNKGAIGTDPVGGSFAKFQSNFFADAGGDRGIAFGTVGGTDTYVFLDANKDGDLDLSVDLMIKLAGVTNLSAADIAA
jgi:hypothetical protein